MNEETTKTPAPTIEKAVEALQSLCDILVDILNPIIEATKTVLEVFNKTWRDFIRTLNPKVLHLALHAKTQRARKKNRRRIMLEFQRYCREAQNEKKMLSMSEEV